jgi:hypothetical protein
MAVPKNSPHVAKRTAHVLSLEAPLCALTLLELIQVVMLAARLKMNRAPVRHMSQEQRKLGQTSCSHHCRSRGCGVNVDAAQAAKLDLERMARDDFGQKIDKANGLWSSAHSGHDAANDLAGQHRMLQMNRLDNTEVVGDINELNFLLVKHEWHEHRGVGGIGHLCLMIIRRANTGHKAGVLNHA